MLNLRFPLAIQGAQLAECVILKLVLKEDKCGRFRFGSQFMICNYVKTKIALNSIHMKQLEIS